MRLRSGLKVATNGKMFDSCEVNHIWVEIHMWFIGGPENQGLILELLKVPLYIGLGKHGIGKGRSKWYVNPIYHCAFNTSSMDFQ